MPLDAVNLRAERSLITTTIIFLQDGRVPHRTTQLQHQHARPHAPVIDGPCSSWLPVVGLSCPP